VRFNYDAAVHLFGDNLLSWHKHQREQRTGNESLEQQPQDLPKANLRHLAAPLLIVGFPVAGTAGIIKPLSY
jgi:hypothetical protein